MRGAQRQIDTAMDADNPKAAMMELIVAAAEAGSGGQHKTTASVCDEMGQDGTENI